MALTADFISYFFCCNIKFCPQYCSLCHHSLPGTLEWKHRDRAEGKLWLFPLELLQLLLHQQTTWEHLQTFAKCPCIWAETSESSVLAGIMLLVEFMRPRRDRDVETLHPCLPYNANEQCWNERLSPCPCHPASLLSFLFPLLLILQ